MLFGQKNIATSRFGKWRDGMLINCERKRKVGSPSISVEYLEGLRKSDIIYRPSIWSHSSMFRTSCLSSGMCLMTRLHRNSVVTLSYPWMTRLRVSIIAFALGRGNVASIFRIRFNASPIISTLRSTARCRSVSWVKFPYIRGCPAKKSSTSLQAFKTSTRHFLMCSSID